MKALREAMAVFGMVAERILWFLFDITLLIVAVLLPVMLIILVIEIIIELI